MGKMRQGGETLVCPWCNLVGWQRHEHKNFQKHVMKRHGHLVPADDLHKCTTVQGAADLRKKMGD